MQFFHIDRLCIKATVCKINNFSVITSIGPQYYCTQLSCAKNCCGETALVNLKLKEESFHPRNIFCVKVFNVGGFLASCLIFKPFLMLDP